MLRLRRHTGKILLWVVSLLLIPPGPAFSLDPGASLDQYINRHWSTKEGLPQNTVYDVVQGPKGYIWIGTDDGLVRFVGIRFKPFNTRNTRALKNNSITCLYVSRDGTLWIGTFGGGITSFKEGNFTHYNKTSGLANEFIWTITEDQNRTLWIGTTGSGLVRYQNGEFSSFTTREGLPNNIVKAILVDRKDRIWLGTENGLAVMDEEKVKVYQVKDGLIDNIIMALHMDSQANLWIGTGNGLTRFTKGKFYNYTQKDGLCHNLIHWIYEDRNLNLWVASEGGLNRINGDKIESLTTEDGLSDNSLLKIFEDLEGNLWIGTSGKGLNMLHNSKFTFYRKENGLAENAIRAIYEDRNNALWIGTMGGGLSRMHRGRVENFTSRHGLNSNIINSVYGDREGTIWVGTRKGLLRYRGGRFSQIRLNPSGHSVSVVSLYRDKAGNLWAGTYGSGLYRIQNGQKEHYTSAEGLANDFIQAIAEDSWGNIWLGSNGGLTRLDNRAIKNNSLDKRGIDNFTQKEGLSNNIVNDIYIDRFEVIWVGTNGGGLNRLGNKKFTIYSTDNGLYSDVIYRILPDSRGNLWMSSNRGIFSITRRELNNFHEGASKSVRCLYLQEDDGMKSSVCCGGFQPAGWRSQQGIMYFPTNMGVAAIHPAKVNFNKIRPPVVIESILANNQPVDISSQTPLPGGTQTLAITFAAMCFTAPEKVRISYKLFGFDKKWTDTPSRETILYQGLTPGNYNFKVIAGNNDNIWNYRGASYKFSIQYRLYERIWFQFLAAVFLFFILKWFYKTRKIRLVRRADEETKYKASTLEPWKSKHFIQKIIDHMKKEKPFMDPAITVEKLSKSIDIPEKHLSQILNEQMEMNFNNFINKYRVEEAKKKLLDPKEKDFVLLKIAFDVGFNSKSAFNAAFKKFASMSPSEFRKKNYGKRQ